MNIYGVIRCFIHSGVVSGAIAFFATIVAVIFLATASPDVGEDLIIDNKKELARFLVHDLFLVSYEAIYRITSVFDGLGRRVPGFVFRCNGYL